MTANYEPGKWWCGVYLAMGQGPCQEGRPHLHRYDNREGGTILVVARQSNLAMAKAKELAAGWSGDGHLTAEEQQMLVNEAARTILEAIHTETVFWIRREQAIRNGSWQQPEPGETETMDKR